MIWLVITVKVLEYTDYSYRSDYTSVSFGYPAVGGMMTWIDIPDTSNNAVDHYITKAGICKIMVSYSKDTNKSCRGSRYDKTTCTSKVKLYQQVVDYQRQV